MNRVHLLYAVTLAALLASPSAGRAEDRDRTEDVVLAWNEVLLDADASDHALAAPDQGGPTRAARAFAIVSAAVFDACNSITHRHRPYLTELKGYDRADRRAAVTAAAYHTLIELYPQQADAFEDEFDRWLRRIDRSDSRTRGLELGRKVAQAILAKRAEDGSDDPMSYTPKSETGFHQEDPNNPGQGFLTPKWGDVDPFVLRDVDDFLSPPPPPLASSAYAAAYNEVLLFGGDDVTTPTIRTPEQTEIGLFWAYDGRPGLGTPPRLYNQIVRVIAQRMGNSTEQNARLFALVNLALADAGIQCWRTKYVYEFWRPIIGIRAGDADGNNATTGDPQWNPLGAPLTNGTPGAPNFTPPFPAYTSGHATFGAAALKMVANFYGTNRISFSFVSDELNGINTDQNGTVRPRVVRHFDSLSEAIEENAQSRIYLGIHWQFDAQVGIASGIDIANYVYEHALKRR
jgi:membrane-associated phospholipid phosphatase